VSSKDYNKIVGEQEKLRCLFTKQKHKLQEAYLKLTTQQQITESQDKEILRLQTLVKKQARHEQKMEAKLSKLKEENHILARAMMQGPKTP